MAQQLLESFDRPLLTVSLSNLTLVLHLFYTRGRVIAWVNYIGSKVLLGREYADKIFAQRPIFSGLRFFKEAEISDSGPTA